MAGPAIVVPRSRTSGPWQPSGKGRFMSHGSMRRTKRRSLIIVVAVVVVIVVAAGAAGGYVLLTRTQGSPRQTAASYLRDWQQGSYAAMGKVSVGVPPAGLGSPAAAGRGRARPAQHPSAARPGQPGRRIGPGPLHGHRRPGQRARVDLSGTASAGHPGPAVAGGLEPVRHLPPVAGRRAVRAERGLAGPGPGAGRRRHRAELSLGDRPVGFHLAAHRHRGGRHQGPGQGARRPLPGR